MKKLENNLKEKVNVKMNSPNPKKGEKEAESLPPRNSSSKNRSKKDSSKKNPVEEEFEEGKNGSKESGEDKKNLGGTYRLTVLNGFRKVCGGVYRYTDKSKLWNDKIRKLEEEGVIRRKEMDNGFVYEILKHEMVGISQAEIFENYKNLSKEDMAIHGDLYRAVLDLDEQEYENLDRFLFETRLRHDKYWH
eukprot:CAMPEP_0114576982 /NCGR_PEP_ID=MMETSP0125-20121206/1692_1 /TAXON_ID=485358 ORGANISM="Aristerostoma sp., Strain ATCC 50986" /NCGR_SAMPLE_ID=MMETSP0125 /ASSEMBLY_ACC=CAM_ASM_000245 /LENGTH=190 /DNA_ID=CAMNT_0001765937 /DNA_START=698 /DNA_END=1270 /DNA_ORIENTATION=+